MTENITTTPGGTSKALSNSHTGTIVGGALGGVVSLLAIGAIALLLRVDRDKEANQLGLHKALFLRTTIDKELKVVMTSYNPGITEMVSPRVRPQTDGQQQIANPLLSPSVVSIPVGLSGKELARLRSYALRPEPTDGQPSDSSLAATADRDVLGGGAAEAAPSPEALSLQSEVDLLRNEVQQLRAERSESEAPPTYVS